MVRLRVVRLRVVRLRVVRLLVMRLLVMGFLVMELGMGLLPVLGLLPVSGTTTTTTTALVDDTSQCRASQSQEGKGGSFDHLERRIKLIAIPGVPGNKRK